LFDTKNVGTGKPVTVTGFTLTGADAGNYAVVQPAGLAASVGAARLAVTGVSALDKVYDATRTVSLAGVPTVAALSSDAVSVIGTASGSFDTKNVGTGKPVTVSGYTLAGADASNYVVVQPAGLAASISPATLAVTGVAADNKTYDATHTATLAGMAVVAPLASDAVTVAGRPSALFDTKEPGTRKDVTVTGYELSGVDAANYAIVQPVGLHADIAAAAAARIIDAPAPVALFTQPPTLPASAVFVTVLGRANGTVRVAEPAVALEPTSSASLPAPVAIAADSGLPAPVLGGSVQRGDQAIRTTYEAHAEDGGALPPWLHFDATSATFSGTAPAGTRALKVLLVTRDGKGVDTSVVLDLNFSGR
jgi:hypothetical protein